MKRSLKYTAGIIGLLVIIFLIYLFRPTASNTINTSTNEPTVNIVLIGAGIMSATLATYLAELQPDWQIRLYERLDRIAGDTSDGWNNAGTGHSGFMEMNYTPEKDGQIDITQAIEIANQFEISKQFWAYQLKHRVLHQSQTFINPVPHIAFVWGKDDINFLAKRYAAMIKNPMFYGMKYSTSAEEIKSWAPLIIEGRDAKQPVAATRMDIGADVNYGEITRQLVANLLKHPNFKLQTKAEVNAISRNDDGTWSVGFKNLTTGEESHIKTRLIFIGAGGATIKLLQYTGLEEAKQYAGFPVGGEFLVTDNPEVVNRHTAKVYGKPALGAPPMSVPHIDTRYLGGKKYVLFGPFATYSNKFLKYGSQLDLFAATNDSNIIPIIAIGIKHLDLVRYLVSQLMLNDEERYQSLLEYYPNAKKADWQLVIAGQRVQIIKNAKNKPITLQFGTETFISDDKTVFGLLGASPGASTSPYIMLNLLEKAFPDKVKNQWNAKLHEIIPSYGQHLEQNPTLLNQIRRYTSEILGLNYIVTQQEQTNQPIKPKQQPANSRCSFVK
ncbi:malate dehydrogenase (quinone) [Candidatus Arsenophonus nilaparvatae]|uniref:malate dehydrogenase (quinone) n=1 Tax=Candidatus Arsenophonus nilaparvatae TaxID=1247023 RepID=UPI0006892BFE|nr:malate dehydrogenase (quinone) [Candidatus Arsenophonus nilaparvatae]